MEIFEKTIQDLSGYLPRIIAAVVVLVLGWLVAWLISALVLRCLRRLRLDDHVKRGTGGGSTKRDAGLPRRFSGCLCC
jgi:hypothetical protein